MTAEFRSEIMDGKNSTVIHNTRHVFISHIHYEFYSEQNSITIPGKKKVGYKLWDQLISRDVRFGLRRK